MSQEVAERKTFGTQSLKYWEREHAAIDSQTPTTQRKSIELPTIEICVAATLPLATSFSCCRQSLMGGHVYPANGTTSNSSASVLSAQGSRDRGWGCTSIGEISISCCSTRTNAP
ncbi:hypothetical protein LZ30DRAFT_725620 [Colletotrichum cereale]|nr:hypothetical protein LZ30DRAFT_725620 [Colletotrichum cereale]